MQIAGAALISLGLAAACSALVYLHLAEPGLSPVHDAVSRYGISPHALAYRVQTLGYGVAGAGAALGLQAMALGATSAVVACWVFAACRAGISWFPMDPPGGRATFTGRYHWLLATSAFLFVLLAASRLASALASAGVHPAFGRASAGLAAAMACALVAMAVTRRPRSGFGIAERAFYLAVTGWLALLAALLTR